MKRGHLGNSKVHRHICDRQTRKFSALNQYKIHDFSDVDLPLERDAQTISLQYLPVSDPDFFRMLGWIEPC